MVQPFTPAFRSFTLRSPDAGRIDPSVRRPSPKPVRVDLRKVFTFGTALWAIALVICMILLAFGINVERLQTMCAAGTVIGVLMLVWEHFDRWDYRRLGE